MAQTTSRVGQYDVTVLLDGIFEAPTDVLMHPAGEAARQRLIETWDGPKIRIDVNCFLLRGPHGISLIDAGCGNAWGPALGHARAVLHDLGVAPEQIDRVLLTHVHGDHAIGLLDGTEPWLPRAEILVPAVDWAFFTDPAARDAQPEGRRGSFDIAANLARAYAGRLHTIPTGPVAALPGIVAMPLPGHTPGHTGYLLHGDGKDLLIWADALHLRDAQIADPAVGLIYDNDPQMALRTRRDLLAQAADAGWLVTGSHVSGLGRIAREGDGFRFTAP